MLSKDRLVLDWVSPKPIPVGSGKTRPSMADEGCSGERAKCEAGQSSAEDMIWGPMDPLRHLSRARSRDGVWLEGSNGMGAPRCRPQTSTVSRNVVSEETPPASPEGTETGINEGRLSKTCEILEAGSGLPELPVGKHGLSFKNKEE